MPTVYRTLLVWLAPVCLFAAAEPGVERLLDRIMQQEQEFAQELSTRAAILETYIQELPDSPGDEVTRDDYFLGRLELSKGLKYIPMTAHTETPRKSKFFFFRDRNAVFVPSGFAQMIVPDAGGFDRAHYNLDYVRREFLGEVRCLVFDISPRDKKAAGKFIGRIWVEDRDLHVVRLNGTYTYSTPSKLYFHFDSWRICVASGQWLPAFVYVEESQPALKGSGIPRFKAQTRLWGYNIAKSGNLEELTSIAVEAEKPVRDQSGTDGLSPLESQRFWERQAETNILERLEKAGLLAPPGPVDQVLNTVIGNLIVTNHLSIEAKCRVLLTTPLETFSLSRTIVISRGLLDVLPDEASLAMVLSDELAHIALGHRTDTHFAFSDQTMLSDEELFTRLRLTRPDDEIQAAGQKAVELLAQSPYKDKLGNAALFLKALGNRSTELPSLIRANLGNQLASPASLARMAPLAEQSPALEQNKLEQIAALPLGSRVRLDPWSNEIALLKAKPVSLLSPRDKLPFEITPFIISLSRAGIRSKEQDPAISDLPAQPSAEISTKGVVH